jgi:thiamine phosphate synthase YjbQ (UPF0047 family)
MTSLKTFSRTPPSTVSATTIVSAQMSVQTPGASFTNLTAEIAKFMRDAHAREGAVTLFIRHTSASLVAASNQSTSVVPS